MPENGSPHSDVSVLSDVATCGLGEMEFQHPQGTFAVTPASRITVRAIGAHQQLLSGIGMDWGTGCGVLAISAARIQAVTKVYGLEIVPVNVTAARHNAGLNSVAEKLEFFNSDSFTPFDESDAQAVAALRGKVQFILANPPSSDGDDGFDFRRRVLRESQDFLVDGGVVFLNISSQYGQQRIANLTPDGGHFTHSGVLATTDWAPFDLTRADLLDCLHAYAQEEERGGHEYEFLLPGEQDDGRDNAQAAMAFYERTRQSPFSKWQTHLFEYHPAR